MNKLFAFVLAIICCCNILVMNNLFAKKYLQKQHMHEQHDDTYDEALKTVWMGDGKAEDGTALALTTYETSGGETVSVTQGEFPSTEKANRQLQRSLREAMRITEKTAKTDQAKHKIGQ